MSVEMVAWRKSVPTHAISVFDVDGSGETDESCEICAKIKAATELN